MTTPGSNTLEYAPARRRCRWKRWIIAGLLIAATVGWKFRAPVIARLQLLRTQSQCLNHSAAPDQIAYEANRIRGKAIADKDSAYTHVFFDVEFRSGVWPLEGTFRLIDCWERFVLTPGMMQSNSRLGKCAVIYLGERVAPNGARRLVVLELIWSGYPLAYVIEPATLRGEPRDLWNEIPAARKSVFDRLPWTSARYGEEWFNGTVYFGQPDPKDESRFTIRMNFAGVECLARGRLNDDDSVSLEIPDAEQVLNRIDAEVKRRHSLESKSKSGDTLFDFKQFRR